MAAEQQGLVTRAQLLSAGLSRHVIDRRLKSGLFRPLHAGVYLVGPVPPPRAREAAALLACPGAVISQRTAGGLWQLLAAGPGEPVHVTVPPERRCGRRPGVCVHRMVLATDEIHQLDGLPLTSPARTLLDLSVTLTARELERATAQAMRAGLTDNRQLHSLLARYPGRGGTQALRALVRSGAPPLLTRSEAEERLLRMIRSAGLPEPEMNVTTHGIEVDCFWRQARLAVEVDGFAFHTSVRAFVRDRQRDAALAAAGVQVLRLSWHQLERARDRTLVQLAQALARAHA